MDDKNLKPLLNTNQEFGFQKEVNSAIVLGEFLMQFWPSSSDDFRSELTKMLLNSNYDVKNLKTGGKDKTDDLVEILKNFLRDSLWTNPDAYKQRINIEKTSAEENNIPNISYYPLNRKLLATSTSKAQLGRKLFLSLKDAFKDNPQQFSFIEERLRKVEQHPEIEEEIISTIFSCPVEQAPQDSSNNQEDNIPPLRAKYYSSLFKQFGDDLQSLLELDIKLLAKPRLLLYLERLVNLYALLYYLRIICNHIDEEEKCPDDLPFILPLCSKEAEDAFKDYTTQCFQVYRSKIVAFWRKYLKDRIEHNAKILKCNEKDAETILEIFLKINVIFPRKPKKEGKEIKDIINQISKFNIDSGIEHFTEAFLLHNLKSIRTVQRLRLILDWQGTGAGLVAPQSGNVKHFHLKPELLELLVIIFYSQNRFKPSNLTLRKFILEIRNRYGIILGHFPGIEKKIEKQGLLLYKHDEFKKNYENFLSMLRELNMLESLSDMAMFIKCPFSFENFRASGRNNE